MTKNLSNLGDDGNDPCWCDESWICTDIFEFVKLVPKFSPGLVGLVLDPDDLVWMLLGTL